MREGGAYANARVRPRNMARHPASKVNADPASPGSISGALVLAIVQVPGDELAAVNVQTGILGPVCTKVLPPFSEKN